jgi:hypothetical protein
MSWVVVGSVLWLGYVCDSDLFYLAEVMYLAGCAGCGPYRVSVVVVLCSCG